MLASVSMATWIRLREAGRVHNNFVSFTLQDRDEIKFIPVGPADNAEEFLAEQEMMLMIDESCPNPEDTSAPSLTSISKDLRDIKSTILSSVRMNRRTFARHFAPLKKDTDKRLTALEGEMKVVQEDVGSLKRGVVALEGIMINMEEAVGTLHGDVDELKKGMGKLANFTKKTEAELERKMGRLEDTVQILEGKLEDKVKHLTEELRQQRQA